MAVVTLTIDGLPVSARSGESILAAAADAGIDIPTLCHMDGVSEAGACRLCLVEVEGRAKPQASCVTAAAEGMIVRTDTPMLADYRRMIVELLFAERNHVCAVCVSNGHCELQDLAERTGMDHVRYDYLHPAVPVDVSHDRFAVDHNRCVMCTRCVRTCDEIEGAHTWDVSGRGVASRVIVDMGGAWGDSVTCTSCGKCVQACPTGALFLQGATAAEMVKDRESLADLVAERRDKQWRV